MRYSRADRSGLYYYPQCQGLFTEQESFHVHPCGVSGTIFLKKASCKILPYFWIPEENLPIRVNRDHVLDDVWQRQGFIHTTAGNMIHYGFIEQFIGDLGRKFNIREISFDRWDAVQMVQNLEDMGFTVVPFVWHSSLPAEYLRGSHKFA